MKAAQTSPVPRSSWPGRCAAGVVAVLCFAWLMLGSQLQADPHGIGTHQQLGLPQCSFEARWDFACPTCGMTTAFTLATHGRLLQAAAVQPAGALLALLVAMVTWVAAFAAVTGCRVEPFLRPIRRRWRLTLAIVAAVVLLGWLTQLAVG